LPPDAKGVYTLFVRARDAAGHESRVAARSSVVVDRHVIADDADAARTGHDGDWRPARNVLGYNGRQFLTSDAAAPDTHFRWHVDPPESGTYGLQACWTEAEDRATQAQYTVWQDDAVVLRATVDQQAVGGRWTPLGEVELIGGMPCVVELDGAGNGVLVADAIRLVRVP
jgi:hypothetical protein